MLCVRDFVGGSDQAGKIVTHTLSVVSAVVDPNHRIPTGLDESKLGSKVPFVKVYLFDRHPRLTETIPGFVSYVNKKLSKFVTGYCTSLWTTLYLANNFF